MSDAAAHDPDLSVGEDLPARDAAILDELAELGLELARGLQQRALAVEGADEAASLAMAFQRVARTVRQCLALKGKLARDARREDRELKREADAELVRRIQDRKTVVRLRLQRAIEDQTPDDDLAGSRLEDLHDRLDEAVLDEGFLDGDLPEVIARLCRALGLRPPGTAEPPDKDRDNDDPGDDDPGETARADPAPASSAPEPWRTNGRLAPPVDLPSWETG